MKDKKFYLIAFVLLIALFSSAIFAGETGAAVGAIIETGTATDPKTNISLTATAGLKNSSDISQGINLTVDCGSNTDCSGQLFTVDFWALKTPETGDAFKSFHDSQKDAETFTYNGTSLSNRYRQFILKEGTSNIFEFSEKKTISISGNSLYYAGGNADARSRAVPSGCNAADSMNKCIKKIWTESDSGEASFSEFVSFIKNKVNPKLTEKYKFYVVLELADNKTDKSKWHVSQNPIPLNETESKAEETEIVLISEIPFGSGAPSSCESCSSILQCLACIDQKIVKMIWK